MNKLITLGLVAALAGCALHHRRARLETASGRPETVVKASTVKAASEHLTNRLLDRGWTILRENGVALVSVRPLDKSVSDVMFGDSLNLPDVRVTFNTVPVGDDVRIVASIEAVKRADNGGEMTVDLNGNASALQAVQSILDEVAAK